MTQSPSLGKVKAIIANDAVLHHKWDNKGATSIIDEGNTILILCSTSTYSYVLISIH